MTQEELQVILEDCRQNKRAAQEQLYKYFYADMFRLCQRYTSDPHVTLSIVNDAFLKAFKSITHYRETLGHFKSWLKTIVINTAIDHLRSQKKDIRLVHIDQVQEQGDEDFTLRHQWKHDELMQHLNCLPTITRTVVNLYAFDGYSHKEIALHLDITETTSRWHLSEARKRLRESLQLNNPKKLANMSEDLRYYFFDHEADDNPSIPSEEGWKQMQQLLDKELPLVTKRKPRRYIFFGIAAITGVILITTALPLRNYFEQNRMFDGTKKLQVITTENNEIKKADKYAKLPDQKKVTITEHLQVIKNKSLELQSIQELSLTVERSQNKNQKGEHEVAGSYSIDVGTQAIDTLSNTATMSSANDKEIAREYSEKKKTLNYNYKKWQINAGVASNVSFSNTLKGLRPYPFAELRYQFSPLFFAGTSIGLFSTVGSNANGIKKTVYINDMSINVSNYAERLYFERLSYADISLTGGIKLNSHLSVQTGVQFSRLLDTKTTTKIEPYDFDMNIVRIQDTNTLQPNPSAAPVYNKNVEPRKLDIRYIAGINYDMKKISLGLQYQAGVNSILKGDAVSNDKNKMITLKATYRFKWPSKNIYAFLICYVRIAFVQKCFYSTRVRRNSSLNRALKPGS